MRVVLRRLSLPISSLLMSMFLIVCVSAQDIRVSTGVICNTQEQVERFVAHYTGDAQIAVHTVNAEEHDTTACGVVTIAYTRVAVLTTVRNKDSAYRVVQVLVLGVVTREGLQSVRPTRQYSLYAVDERVA